MAKALYFQSGGPSPVINASLAGYIKEAHRLGIDPYGARYGVEGLLDSDFVSLSNLSEKEVDTLSHTPGMALGSSRKNLPDDLSSPEYLKALQNLTGNGFSYLLVNGGNDSMLTALRLSMAFKKRGSGISVIGIPKTVDNDLYGSDHSLGYPSASLHVLNHVKMVALDGLAYRNGKVQLVETMGRDTGWLAASSDLLEGPLHPDLILLPESPYPQKEILEAVRSIKEKKNRALIVLSEGVNPEAPEETDPFGHPCLEGAAYHWASLIKKELGYSSRVTVLSAPSRSDPVLISKIDCEEALEAGALALRRAAKGETGLFLSLTRVSTDPYRYSYRLKPLSEIGGKVRYIPKEYLGDMTHMSPAFRAYLKPLLTPLSVSLGEDGLFPSYLL